MQLGIFIDCVGRYNARYAAQIAEVLPKLMRQKAINHAEPLRRLVRIMILKEESPYGYASLLVRIRKMKRSTAP